MVSTVHVSIQFATWDIWRSVAIFFQADGLEVGSCNSSQQPEPVGTVR